MIVKSGVSPVESSGGLIDSCHPAAGCTGTPGTKVSFGSNTKVYLAAGSTGMRQAVNGLMVLVQGVLVADPFSSHLSVFSNRLRDKIKILYWPNNGFWLFYRRIEELRISAGIYTSGG